MFIDEEGIGGDQDSDNPLMILFNGIYHHTDPTGRSLSEPFFRLPSKRFDYFFWFIYNDTIIPKKGDSVLDWGSRIKRWKNVQNSAIYHHTELIINRKGNNLNKHYFLNSASLLSFEGNICGEMYCLNIHAYISLFFPIFCRAYPDYYEVIKQPIALSKIRSQIKVSHVKAD